MSDFRENLVKDLVREKKKVLLDLMNRHREKFNDNEYRELTEKLKSDKNKDLAECFDIIVKKFPYGV